MGKAAEIKILRRYGNNGDVADYTVASGTAIPKGYLLKLTDPETAIEPTNNTAAEMVAGITASAKDSDDTSTRIGLVTNCDARCTASGAITIGDPLESFGNNYIGVAAVGAAASGAITIGYSKETAANGESCIARIKL